MAFSKSTVDRPTDHRPPSHRPTIHRPPSHRPKIYFKDQISLISENWTSAARMQLKLGRMDPYRLKFIFLKNNIFIYLNIYPLLSLKFAQSAIRAVLGCAKLKRREF